MLIALRRKLRMREDSSMQTWIDNNTGLIAVLALAVAVVAIPVTVWATRRWGNRRGRLIVGWESVRMVTGTSVKGVEVRLDGKEIEDPHLVTVDLYNAGPNDISRSSFDGARPLQAALVGAKSIDLVVPFDDQFPHMLADNGATLLLGPGHLPTKEGKAVTLITEGEPTSIHFGDLVDVDVTCVPGTDVAQDALRALVAVLSAGLFRFR